MGKNSKQRRKARERAAQLEANKKLIQEVETRKRRRAERRAAQLEKVKPVVDKRVELDKQSREINQNLNQNTLNLIYERKWYTYQHLPYGDGNSGVYIIKFPNNKRYVGSSNHVIKRLKTHMSHLEYRNGLDWYKQAAEENELRSGRQKNIDRMVINVCYCYDYRDYESSILSSIPEEEQCYWYNSIFR